MNRMKRRGNAVAVLTREEYLRQLAASGEPLNICLTNNFAFRKTFKNKKVLKGFLMALLGLEDEQIKRLEVIDPYEEGEGAEEKEGILDVKVYLNDGQKINIEMQNRYQEDWTERSLFYNCRMFAEGYVHGTPYGDMEPCIHVGILDFTQMKSRGFHHCIMLQDIKTEEVYSSKFIFHVVELKKLEETPKEERDELYRWARLIAAKSWEAVCMEAKGNPYMEAARDEMNKINQSEKERYLYLREAMALSDEASRLATAKKEGNIQGMVEAYIELGISKEDILDRLEKKLSLSEEEAQKYLKKYGKGFQMNKNL